MQNTIVGGEDAIRATHDLIAKQRRGDPKVPELTIRQVREQLGLGVDRVMCEGGVYDRDLAAVAIAQAQGDMVEAICLLRTFRASLRRFGASEPVVTDSMLLRRRVATTYRSPPGGQYLGATYDYTHRLLGDEGAAPDEAAVAIEPSAPTALGDPLAGLAAEGMIATEAPGLIEETVADLTRDKLSYPARRDLRLQTLARADEGFLSSIVNSALHELGGNHPLISDLRIGDVEVEFVVPELGFAVGLADVTVTECRTTHETAAHGDHPAGLTSGYGLALGQSERKGISMAFLDRTLRAGEFGEEPHTIAQDERLVLENADAMSVSGQVQHLKLPHYVDFEAQLQTLRQVRADQARRTSENAHAR